MTSNGCKSGSVSYKIENIYFAVKDKINISDNIIIIVTLVTVIFLMVYSEKGTVEVRTIFIPSPGSNDSLMFSGQYLSHFFCKKTAAINYQKIGY